MLQRFRFFFIIFVRNFLRSNMQLTRFVNAFKRLETPFYFYDLDILDQTLRLYTKIIRKYGYHAHYAMKANANPKF